ncbi:hypothetical protein [Wenxinia marina]|uniref:Uncharacterized protein n=1 Tax=Wenxinia marina DSM 24838 TaxID=1123501 RepID=A0A0D0Q8U6_9RHOB|nr:hypothetical protein [Wenxinia marina]KIQ70829.1 hypothetical protein Wenmar_00203 [Wenxinia marina DSM 24838]GGL56976.1 hypothetical protein GCM10011392_09300 [Wenxinia marina]
MEQTPITRFGTQDAILVARSQRDVARAIAALLTFSAEPDAPPRAGLVGRLLGRRRAAAPQARALPTYTFRAVTPAEADLPLIGWRLADGRTAEADETIRLSTPVAAPDWTLVETCETVHGISMTALGLSAHLPGSEALYLRRTIGKGGPRQAAFHVYREAEAVRRIACTAIWADGRPASEWWERIADGAPTAYEPAGLMTEGAFGADHFGEAGIEAILGRLGLSLDTLLGPRARRDAHAFERAAEVPAAA